VAALHRPGGEERKRRLAFVEPRILAEVGIAPDPWTRSDHHPTRALVDDLAAGRMDRASAYATCAMPLTEEADPAA
jgi:hypothetical protein